MPPRELSDDEVFGGREMSDEEVFAPAQPTQPRRKSFSLGVEKGLEKPIDNMALAMDAGLRRIGIPTDQIARATGQPTTRETVASNKAELAKREQTEQPRTSGEVFGNVFGTIPAMIGTRNPFIAGGLQGAALTDKRDVVGVGGDMAKGAALQWAGGKVLDKVADVVSPIVSPAVKRLSDAGVKLTPGMRRGGKAMVSEDKAMSRPVVGPAIAEARGRARDTFNTTAVNEALQPLGLQVPTPIKPGHAAVDWAADAVSAEYDRVIPNVAVKIDGQQFAQNLAPVAQALPAAQRKEFQRLISLHLKSGQLQGQELKTAQGELRRLSSLYGRSQVAADNELGRALGAVDDELSGAMIAQNPQWAPQLQKVNTAYRGLKVVEDAASRTADGTVTPAQLRQAVRRGDRSKGKSQMGRGNAFMQDFAKDAEEVLPAQTPNSGTADRLMAGNVFQNLRGAADLAGFKTSALLDEFGPRVPGQIPARVAGGVRRLKRPLAAGAVAASQDPRN